MHTSIVNNSVEVAEFTNRLLLISIRLVGSLQLTHVAVQCYHIYFIIFHFFHYFISLN